MKKLFLSTLIAASALAAPAFAADVTWTGATDGTWDTSSANWTGGSGSTFTTDDNVTFDGTAAGTITLGEAIVAGNITFNAGGYTITDGEETYSLKADSITVGAGARGSTTTIAVSTLEITGTIGIQTTGDSSGTNPRVLVIGDGSNVTTATAAALYMQGDSVLQIAKDSTLTVSGNMTESGGFDETISGEGTLIIQGTVTHSNGHGLTISIANFQAGALTISGGGSATFSGSSATIGTITVSSASAITFEGGGEFSITGDYTVVDSSSTQGASLTVGEGTSVTMKNYEAYWHQGTTTLGDGATLTVTTQMWFHTNATEELTGGTFNIQQLTISNAATVVSVHDAVLNIGYGDDSYGNNGLKNDTTSGGYFAFGDNLTVGVYAGTSGENTGWSTTSAIQFTGESTGTTFSTNSGETITLGGTLTGSGFTNTGSGTLILSGTVSLDSAISNSGTIAIDSNASFALDNLTMGTNGGDGSDKDYYIVIEGGSGSVTGSVEISNFTGGKIDSTWSVYTSDGYLVVYGEASGTSNNLVWAGTADSNTWTTSSDVTDWANTSGTTGYYFSDGANVTFDGSGYSTVTLGDAIVAGTIDIRGSTGYTISNGEGGTSLSASSLTVETNIGITTTIDVSTLVVEGQLAVKPVSSDSSGDRRVLIIGDGTNTTTATAGSLLLQGESQLQIAANSKLTVETVTDTGGYSEVITGEGTLIVTDTFTHRNGYGFDISIANFQAADFSIESGGSVTFSGANSTITGTLLLGSSGDSLTYTGTGNHTVGELIAHTTETVTLDYSDLTGSLTITKVDFGNSGTLEINGSASGTITEVSFTNTATLAISGTVNVGTMNITTSNDMGAITIAEGATLNVTGAINVYPGGFSGGNYSTITGAGADKSTVVAGSINIGSGTTGAGLEVKDTTLITGGISFSQETSAGMFYLYLDDVTLGFTKEEVTIAAAARTGYSYIELGDKSSSTETTDTPSTTTINTNLYDTTTGAFTDTGVTVTIAESIAGTGTLAVTGNGSLTLSGTNTYTGGTVINAGAVIAANNSALGTGDVTIENGGQLSVSDGVTISNNINIVLSEANISAVTPNSVMTAYAADSDVYALIGSGSIGDVTITITVDEAVAQLLASGGEYTFNIYESGLTVSDVSWALSALDQYQAEWNEGTGQLILRGLPEPSMFGFFFGLGAIGLVATRRRRRAA